MGGLLFSFDDRRLHRSTPRWYPTQNPKTGRSGHVHYTFCLDEISFRRDYKSCRIGVVVVVDVIPHLWKLCNFVTFVILELHFWDLVQCLLISFCFGSEILKKIGPPQPPKIPQKPPKTLRIYMNLWKLCDYVTYVNLELEVWNLVQCLLISFCFGSKILVEIGPP